jgi:succinate dehydrogenase / fumarate reductase, membrane anchor subunit
MVQRSPLGLVRGLGSSRSGTEHYVQQKITSYALIPLSIFFLGLVIALAGEDHATVAATLARPYISLPLLMFVIANAVHMRLGMDVVIEDYVHHKALKPLATTLNLFFSYGVAAATAFALLKIGFGG